MVAEIDLGIDELSDFQVIGRGGFSTIYSAQDSGFNRRVAVKLLHSLDDSGRRRFDRERGIMGQLSSHPNVIMPFRAGYARTGAPYLVMELVTGGSLQDLIDTRGGLPWREAVELVLPVTAALGHAHEQGILHRDVKPANIVLAGRVPKLTDFGIAAIRESTTTQVAYTLAHCPPEAFASGEDTRDDRSDLYSMASTLYNLITGRPPYYIDGTDSPQAYMFRIMGHEIPPVPPEVIPPALWAFLQRALAKDPNHRPQDARAFEDELRAVLTAEGGAAVTAPGPSSGGSGDAGWTTAAPAAGISAPAHPTVISGPGLAPPAHFRVVLGPQADYFTGRGIATFLEASYTVTVATDRMGMRLDGPAIEHAKGYNIVSDGIAPGSIQVPGNGLPIVLLADRQATGGYPKIATVVSADLPALGRLAPGAKLAFEAVDLAGARALRREHEAMLARLRTSIRPVASDQAAPSPERLMNLNLVSGVIDAQGGPPHLGGPAGGERGP